LACQCFFVFCLDVAEQSALNCMLLLYFVILYYYIYIYLSYYKITIMYKKSLQIQQLNNKMLAFASLGNVDLPPTGWLKAIRNAIGMSMLQLGNRLSITKQSVQDIERREKEGSVTIKALREVARALDMRLVYGFVPNEGSLEALIHRKAKELATHIVMRTNNTMRLEDQENTKQRIEKAIEERTTLIKNEMPKILWNLTI
jgi:predicted DNA-binding mobile mystery protein A